MNQYRTPGVWWQPKTKRELIDWLVKSGRWKETKQKLLNMDIKELRGIYNGIRQQIDIEFKRKPIHLSNGQASANDTAKEGDAHGT